MALDAKTAKSISQQISKISAGVSKLSQAKSKGMKISSSSSVQDAERYLGGGKSEILDTPRGVGGRIDRNTGEVSNLRNSAGPLALSDVQMEGTDPNALAPQSMIDQRDQLESQVGNLAKSKGLTLKKTPQGGYTTTPDLASQYRQGLDNVMGSGVDAPDSGGLGSLGVNNAMKGLGQEQEYPSVWGSVYEKSPGVDKDFIDYDEWMSPLNQRQTITDEYKSLQKSLTIGGKTAGEIDMEMIDAEAIINGTEDSIRAEITATGGFATDSQVQALAIARNKTLLMNYDRLVSMKKSLDTQLSTTMELSIQDRKFAESEFDRKMDYVKTKFNMEQQMAEISRNQLKYALENGAGSEILKSPYETRLVEKTLGLGTGGLAGIVARQDLEKRYREAQIADIYNGMETGFVGTIGTPGSSTSLVNPTTGKVDPRAQIANIMAETGAKTDDKLKLTGAVISAIQDLATNNKEGNIAGISALSPRFDFMKSSKGKENSLYLSALEGTIEAWMTGASVSEDQQKRIKKDMVPRRGDTNATIRTKLNALANYMMSYTAGSLATQGVIWSPSPIDFFSNPVVVAPNGEEYEITE